MSRCWTCGLPERRELECGRDAGVPLSVLAEWLVVECGYEGPNRRIVYTLSRHFNRGRRHGWGKP